MSTTEITVGQFRQFVNETGYQTEAEKDGIGGWGIERTAGGRRLIHARQFNWKTTGFDQTDAHPVVNVSWNDAIAYCKWASLNSNENIRLPTELEWEFACRAGSDDEFPFGDSSAQLVLHANVLDMSWQENGWKAQKQIPCPANDGAVFTSPTGRYRPNSFGLYDMFGNIFEWLQDDPKDASKEADERVCRGGSWFHGPLEARSSSRTCYAANNRDFSLGFRVVCEIGSVRK